MSLQILEMLKSFVGKDIPAQAPPVMRWLNPTFLKVEEGYSEVELEVRSDMLNPLGILHGGVQSMILDEIMGMTVAALDKPYPAVSINLYVDFLGKAKEKDRIIVTASILKKGRQVIQVLGEIKLADGTLIAKANANLLNLIPKS